MSTHIPRDMTTKALMSSPFSSLPTCYPSTSTLFVQWNTTARRTALQ